MKKPFQERTFYLKLRGYHKGKNRIFKLLNEQPATKNWAKTTAQNLRTRGIYTRIVHTTEGYWVYYWGKLK